MYFVADDITMVAVIAVAVAVIAVVVFIAVVVVMFRMYRWRHRHRRCASSDWEGLEKNCFHSIFELDCSSKINQL